MAKKYGQGQSLTNNLSASGLNRATDVAEWYANQKTLGNVPTMSRYFDNGVDIKVRNDTGSDLTAGSTIAVMDYLLTEGSNKTRWFSAEVLASDTNTIGITLEPIKSGAIGPARVSGICFAWVYFSTATDTRAAPVVGGTYLGSISALSGEGVKVVAKFPGTGLMAVPVILPIFGATSGVPFRNQSGEIVPAFAVMRITGGVVSGLQQIVTIAKPSTAFQRNYLVNNGSPVAIGADGAGTYLSDAGYVLYGSGSPAYGESWGPKASQWTLEKYRYGFTIIGANTGSGSEARTWARQGEVNEFYGQTDGTHNKGATGTISIFDGDGVDTTDNMSSVLNVFANVATGKKVGCRWWGGKWYLVAAECG